MPFLSLLPNGDKRYRIQDNLGSTRVVLSADGAVYDWTNYEPFGTVLNSGGGQQNSDRFSYIGKEKDAESDLGDFGVRKYESETGRFLSTDPLWEEQRPWNVYHYSANNPIVAKDPDGKLFDVIIDVAFIAYDVYDIGKTLAKGERVSGTQIAALGADVVSAVVPGLTGGGALVKAAAFTGGAALVKAAAHADDIAKATTQAVKSVGNTVKAASSLKPLELDKNTMAASKAKTNQAKERQKEKERDAAKNKSKEHTKGARPSTTGKHEKGQARKDQKYNDKKRSQDGWQQNLNKRK